MGAVVRRSLAIPEIPETAGSKAGSKGNLFETVSGGGGVVYSSFQAYERDYVLAQIAARPGRVSQFTFRRMAGCGFALAAAFLLVVCVTGAVFAVLDMQDEADVSVAAAKPQIESGIEESFKLLETLADRPEFYDASVPVMDKVAILDQINERYGYFLLCFVDEDINVWDASGPASLASRDFMQKLYSTGTRLVTDSFAAGADGVTLNYTVLVPLFDGDKMTGSLFVSLYFDDMVDVLERSASSEDVSSVLVGSRGQVMSSSSGFAYDDRFLDPIRSHIAFGMTADAIEEELLSLNPVSFWTVDGLDLRYYAVEPIANTSWDAVCVTSFWAAYAKIMRALAPFVAIVLALIAGAFMLLRADFARQTENARMLEQSVEDLQKTMFDERHRGDADVTDILELTSSGLSDGLTGVVTRSVFSSRLENLLEDAHGGSLYALCFVDLDDFKHVNDAYGHAAGDAALKNVGYVLRTYERRYDGLVGRYGGDEFVLLMTDLDDEDELLDVLAGMVADLSLDLQFGDEAFKLHCSVGAAVWDGAIGIDELTEQADQALYRAKHQGKGRFSVFGDGSVSEAT